MVANALQHTNSATTVLNLNDGTTYDLISVDGIYSMTSEVLTAPIPAKLPVAIYLASDRGMREITVNLRVRGATLSALITNVRALETQFNVDVRDDRLGTLQYEAWNSNVRATKVALKKLELSDWTWRGTASTASTLAALTLLQPDPTWYNPTAVTPSGAFNGATPVNISCANAGDTDAYPTITYTQAAGSTTVGPQVTDAYGRICLINNTMAASSSLVMNFDPQAHSMVYTVGGVDYDWFGYRAATALPIRCKFGTQNLVFVATSGTAIIGISFVSRYSTHG